MEVLELAAGFGSLEVLDLAAGFGSLEVLELAAGFGSLEDFKVSSELAACSGRSSCSCLFNYLVFCSPLKNQRTTTSSAVSLQG